MSVQRINGLNPVFSRLSDRLGPNRDILTALGNGPVHSRLSDRLQDMGPHWDILSRLSDRHTHSTGTYSQHWVTAAEVVRSLYSRYMLWVPLRES